MTEDTVPLWHNAEVEDLQARLVPHNRMLTRFSPGHYVLIDTKTSFEAEHFPSIEAVKEHVDALDRSAGVDVTPAPESFDEESDDEADAAYSGQEPYGGDDTGSDHPRRKRKKRK